MRWYTFLFVVLCCMSSAGAEQPNMPEHERIARLIKQLEDVRFDVRRNAFEALVETGLPALPQIIDAAKDPPNREIKYRALLALEKMRHMYLANGSRVTLAAEQTNVSDVFLELSRQSGTEIALGDDFADAIVAVDYSNVGFWEAMVDACQKSGNRCDLVSSPITICEGDFGHVVPAGPLLIELSDMRRALERRRSEDPIPGADLGKFEAMFFRYMIYCEDRLQPLAVRCGDILSCTLGPLHQSMEIHDRGVLHVSGWSRDSPYQVSVASVQLPPDNAITFDELTIRFGLSLILEDFLPAQDLGVSSTDWQHFTFTFTDLPIER